MFIKYNEKEIVLYTEEKIVKFYLHVSYALACTELYLRKCNRANVAKNRYCTSRNISLPRVGNTLFWRRYAGSATTTVAATSFRRVPCGYRRPRRKIYGKSPFGGSQRYALWRAHTKKSVRAAIFIRSFTGERGAAATRRRPNHVRTVSPLILVHPTRAFALRSSGRPTQK